MEGQRQSFMVVSRDAILYDSPGSDASFCKKLNDRFFSAAPFFTDQFGNVFVSDNDDSDAAFGALREADLALLAWELSIYGAGESISLVGGASIDLPGCLFREFCRKLDEGTAADLRSIACAIIGYEFCLVRKNTHIYAMRTRS